MTNRNVRDELTSITKPDGSVVSFTYNAQGRRASKTAGGVTTNYLYDGNKLVAEKQSGTLIASYFYDDKDQLVSVSRGGANYYYHYNAHGDVTRITDQSGSVVASYEYDPWGNIIGSSGSFANSQPFRYAGYLYDPETGLYYLINRYYDPSIGRFISRDPRVISPPDSIGANPYLYVRNNPVNATDPDGLGPTGEVWGRVVNSAGNPIVGATVRICNSAWGNYIQPDNGNIMPSNFNGEFHFTLIPDGSYTIYYDAVGYDSQVQTGIVVSGGGSATAPTVVMRQPSPASQPALAPQPAPGPQIIAEPAPPKPEIVAAPEPLRPSPTPVIGPATAINRVSQWHSFWVPIPNVGHAYYRTRFWATWNYQGFNTFFLFKWKIDTGNLPSDAEVVSGIYLRRASGATIETPIKRVTFGWDQRETYSYVADFIAYGRTYADMVVRASLRTQVGYFSDLVGWADPKPRWIHLYEF